MRDYLNLLVKVGVGAVVGGGVGFIFALSLGNFFFGLSSALYQSSLYYYFWQDEDEPIPFKLFFSIFAIFIIPPGMLYGAIVYPLLKSMEVPLIRRMAVVSSVGLVVGILGIWVRGIIGGELVVLLPNGVAGLLVGTIYSGVLGILAHGDNLYLPMIKQRLLQNLLRGTITGLGFAAGITLIEFILFDRVASFLLLVPNMVLGLSGGILFWLLDRPVTERLDQGLIWFIQLFPSLWLGLFVSLFVGGVVSSQLVRLTHVYMSSPPAPSAKMVLPDTEIVFQTQLESYGAGSIGFVNSDGTGLQIIPLPRGSGRGVVVAPVRTSDGAYVVFYKTTDFNSLGRFSGPTFFDPGNIGPIEWGSDEPSGYLKTIGPSGYLTRISYPEVEGKIVPIRSTHQVIVKDWAYNKYIINLDNGKYITTTHLPGWDGYIPSPDGKSAAFVSHGIIYLKDLTTHQFRELVSGNTSECNNLPWSTPSWSPDGQWLVYHRLEKGITSCEDVLQHTAIYKYHLATGQETKLVDGGVNPYWSQMKTK